MAYGGFVACFVAGLNLNPCVVHKRNALEWHLPALIFTPAWLTTGMLWNVRVDLNQRSLKLSLTVHKRRSVGTETAPFLVA